MTALTKLEAKLKQLPDSDFAVGVASKSAATEVELAAVEKKAGMKLPPELRKLLSKQGALRVEAKPAVWPRMKEFDIGPAWRFWHGFSVLDAAGIKAALTPGMVKAKLLPVLRREGAKWVSVVGAKGVGTCLADGSEFEASKGDVIDLILAELQSLEELVEKQRTKASGTDALMEQGRQTKWKGPKASDVVDALKERPSAELAPHLPELCKALLPGGQQSMGCLDIIAQAGPEAFAPVAKLVYAHFGKGDSPYVLELLGKVADVSKPALAIYVKALDSDDDDTRTYAVQALAALSDRAEVKGLLAAIEKRYGKGFDDADARFEVLSLLGKLGSKKFATLVAAGLDEVEDDDEFGSLLSALEGQELAATLKPRLLARAKEIEPASPSQFNAVQSLVTLGVKDRAFMEPIAREFEKRGGMWAPRAKAVLHSL